MADEGTQETGGAQEFTAEQYQALMQERTSLLAKNQELLGEVKKGRDKFKAYEGIDPEKARAAEARLAELEQQTKADKAGITSQQLEQMRQEVRGTFEKEYTPYRERAEALEKENRALKLDNRVKKLMGENGVSAKRVNDLFRLTADDYDLTDDGEPMLKDRMGVPIETYIKEDLRKSYPEWFDGTGSSGGGATKSVASGGGSRVVATGDNAAFLANLEGIAKGSVQVR